MGIPMWIVWLILTVVFLIIEAVTLGLATVWCAAGSLAAMVMDLCGCSTTWQLIVMIVVSVICFVICMIWIKPQFDKRQKNNFKPTNADRVLNQEGVVIKTINPIEGVGQIKVMGQIWSAKASEKLEEGTLVKVDRMEGVKLFVHKI